MIVNIVKKIACAGICALFVSVAAPAMAALKVGVLAPRGELVTVKEWGEFGKYLSAELGQPVSIVPLAPPRVMEAASNKEVDYVLSHAAHTIQIQEKLGGAPIATLNGNAGTSFAGVIVARKGGSVAKAEDLKGKRIMSLDKSAAGAYIFQAHHLAKKGLSVNSDLSLTVGKKQDDLVLAVKAGLADAAFVRTGVLESMEKEGKIKMDEFVIVDQRQDKGFSQLHSTILYPEWYLSALASAPTALTGKLKGAVTKIDPAMPAASSAQIKGFVAPLPLKDMKDALRLLKLPPYNE